MFQCSYVLLVIKESWWNGRHGRIAQRRARLRHALGQWTVELVGPWSRDEVVHCDNETDAREVMKRELVEGEQWRRLDHLHRPPPQ